MATAIPKPKYKIPTFKSVDLTFGREEIRFTLLPVKTIITTETPKLAKRQQKKSVWSEGEK